MSASGSGALPVERGGGRSRGGASSGGARPSPARPGSPAPPHQPGRGAAGPPSLLGPGGAGRGVRSAARPGRLPGAAPPAVAAEAPRGSPLQPSPVLGRGSPGVKGSSPAEERRGAGARTGRLRRRERAGAGAGAAAELP